MTEKEAIMVLQMVEAHGSLPIKAKAMAIEALRLADKCGQIWEDELTDRERCYQYSDAVAFYYDYVDTINSQIPEDIEKKKLYIKIFQDYEPSDVADRLYQMFDVPTLKKIAEELLDYEEAEE